MSDDTAKGCHVSGCGEAAIERAPDVFFCDRHWDALCDAYVRARRGDRAESSVPASQARAS